MNSEIVYLFCLSELAWRSGVSTLFLPMRPTFDSQTSLGVLWGFICCLSTLRVLRFSHSAQKPSYDLL